MGERFKRISELVEASEMACSLRYEDFRGCPYNSITPREIATLAVTSSFFAVVSLMFAWYA